jgi:hypothetical protein
MIENVRSIAIKFSFWKSKGGVKPRGLITLTLDPGKHAPADERRMNEPKLARSVRLIRNKFHRQRPFRGDA